MTTNPLKFIAASALVAGMAFGGAQLASAQTDSSTTTETPSTTQTPSTTETPSTDGTAPEGTAPENCHDKDGADTGGTANDTSTQGTAETTAL